MKNSLALVLLFVVSAGSADAMIIRLGGVLEEDYYPEMQKGDRITAEITMPDPRLHEKKLAVAVVFPVITSLGGPTPKSPSDHGTTRWDISS